MALSHCVTVECDAPADAALAFLADGIALGGWALGCLDTEEIGERTFRGRAIDSGNEAYVRITSHREQGLVAYEVGSDAVTLVPRIWATVQPRERDTCLLTLLAWRAPSATDEEWHRTCAFHEAEILVLKGQLERR